MTVFIENEACYTFIADVLVTLQWIREMPHIVASVTSKGQVTIPVAVRRRLGLNTRDKIAFVIDDQDVRIIPARQTVGDLYGSVPALPGRETIDFEDQIDEALSGAAERIVRSLEHT